MIPIQHDLTWDLAETLPSGSSSGAFGARVGPLAEGALRVLAFEGREAVNELYAYEVLLVAAATTTGDLRALLGERAHLCIPFPGGERWVHGIVAELTERAAPPGARVFAVRLVPRAWLLTRGQDSRVFQGLGVDAIVSEVLTAHGVPHVFALSHVEPPRAYRVQYQESDFAFVTRLLSEHGLTFRFEQQTEPDPGERLVIFDATASYQPIDGDDELHAVAAEGAIGEHEGTVSDVERAHRVEPSRVTLRDYDHLRATPRAGQVLPTPAPGAPVSVAAGVLSAAAGTAQRPSVEVYDPSGRFGAVDVAAAIAERRLEQLRARADECRGRSRCRRLVPGRTFQLRSASGDTPEGSFVVTEVVLRGRDGSGAERPATFASEFLAVPSHVLCRPPPAARPVVHAVQSAVVVGPSDEELAVAPGGAVRVQFHWDRRGSNDERSSSWLRVMQPWSGTGYGFQFTPRVGTEVLVSFLGGDPDRPVVVGCLPSPLHALPLPLPQDAHRSAIRSRSTPGGNGYNELCFDDAAGAEVLALTAQRDHHERVAHDQRVDVGGAQRITVAGPRSVVVGGFDETVVESSRSVEVRGDTARQVHGRVAEHVGGSVRQTIGGDHDVTVAGQSSVRVDGAVFLTVGAGGRSDLYAVVTGTCGLTGNQAVELRSPTAIRFRCGQSVLSLTPEGVEIVAPCVHITSPEIVVGNEEAGIAIEGRPHGEQRRHAHAQRERAEAHRGAQGGAPGPVRQHPRRAAAAPRGERHRPAEHRERVRR